MKSFKTGSRVREVATTLRQKYNKSKNTPIRNEIFKKIKNKEPAGNLEAGDLNNLFNISLDTAKFRKNQKGYITSALRGIPNHNWASWASQIIKMKVVKESYIVEHTKKICTTHQLQLYEIIKAFSENKINLNYDIYTNRLAFFACDNNELFNLYYNLRKGSAKAIDALLVSRKIFNIKLFSRDTLFLSSLFSSLYSTKIEGTPTKRSFMCSKDLIYLNKLLNIYFKPVFKSGDYDVHCIDITSVLLAHLHYNNPTKYPIKEINIKVRNFIIANFGDVINTEFIIITSKKITANNLLFLGKFTCMQDGIRHNISGVEDSTNTCFDALTNKEFFDYEKFYANSILIN
jgi:hypothetical protein